MRHRLEGHLSQNKQIQSAPRSSGTIAATATTMTRSSGAMQSCPSASCTWFSASSSGSLFVLLLCLLSARAHDLDRELWSPKAALVPPQVPSRRASSSVTMDDATRWIVDPPPSNVDDDDDEESGNAAMPAAEPTGEDRVVKRSVGLQPTSATGSKLTPVNRTHQRSRDGGGSSRQSPKYKSVNDSEKRANRRVGGDDGSPSDVYPTTASQFGRHPRRRLQQRGRPSSGHRREEDDIEDDDGEEDDDDDEDEDDDEGDDGDSAFPLTASSSRSVPSLLAFASPRAKEPRDKMLKSSKDALIVTKKSYLKKDWCKTEPLIQKVREAGCITRTIVNRFCYGQCNSFYIPKNAKMDIESTAFKSCSFCKPKRFRWITITLHCPGRNPPYKRKRIQRIKKCKCISEILQ